MNSIEETLVRNMIRQIFVVANEGGVDLSDQTRALLAGITPLQIEQVVDLCRVNIRLDLDSMFQNIRRVRNHALMLELVKAGASNRLLRELFGVSSRELSRLRAETGANTPSRRALTEHEEPLVLERLERSPINQDSSFGRAIWSLGVATELGLPIMAVYRGVAERNGGRT